MTIAEAINFYDEDEEKYNLNKNTEFLTFLKKVRMVDTSVI